MEKKKIKDLVTTYVVSRIVGNDKMRKQFEKKHMNETEVPLLFCRHMIDLFDGLIMTVRIVEKYNNDSDKEIIKGLEELFTSVDVSDELYLLLERTFEIVKRAIREEAHLHLKKAS